MAANFEGRMRSNRFLGIPTVAFANRRRRSRGLRAFPGPWARPVATPNSGTKLSANYSNSLGNAAIALGFADAEALLAVVTAYCQA